MRLSWFTYRLLSTNVSCLPSLFAPRYRYRQLQDITTALGSQVRRGTGQLDVALCCCRSRCQSALGNVRRTCKNSGCASVLVCCNGAASLRSSPVALKVGAVYLISMTLKSDMSQSAPTALHLAVAAATGIQLPAVKTANPSLTCPLMMSSSTTT
jgi:hypothetical protein